MGVEGEERWQSNITCIREGVNYLWETKDFADAKILVNGHSIEVHKLILAARSSEFARLFLTPGAPNEIVVGRKNLVTKEGVEVLLHFIYKDELVTKNKLSVIEGYFAAAYFKQNLMQARCLKEIELWNLVSDEVCDLLTVGSDIPQLKDKCISFIKNNAEAVISSDSFKRASFKSVCIILESGALESVPVLQRIKHVMNWTEGEETAGPANYSLVRKKLTDVQPSLLGNLGFDKLSLLDLPVITKEYSGLLTPDENTKFLLYHSTNDKKDLPEWCFPSV